MHKEENKVAIILPVYNTGPYLRECLDSLCHQTYENFSIFAVDDGSTDNSGAILEEYARADSRIQVTHKSNGGVSSARNVALNQVRSSKCYSFVGFVDSDDSVERDYIEKFVLAMKTYDVDYCVCGVHHYNTFKTTKSGVTKTNPILLDSSSAIRHFCGINEWKDYPSNLFVTSRFFRTALIGSERFNLNLKTSEDQDFILRLLVRINKGVLIPDVLYHYRQRASSLSHSLSSSTIDSSMRFANYLICGDISKQFPSDVKEGITLRVCDSWWQETRKAYTTNPENKKKVKEFFDFIQKHCDTSQLPKKFKKRFLIFSCGSFITSLYFAFNKREKKVEKMYA